MRINAFKSLFLAAALAAGSTAWAAGISVDSLELLSHGGYTASSGFTVKSRLYFDLSFEGGDKFAGLLKMDFLSPSIEDALSNAGLTLKPTGTADTASAATNWSDLSSVMERLNSTVSPRVRTASVTAKRLFGLPLELTYFVGSLDTMCSGNDFMTLFGSAPVGTVLKGPMVFPDGIKGAPNLYYDGLDAIYGTGFKLGLIGKKMAGWLYAYQDSDLQVGSWTANARGLFDLDSLKLELFGGASYASGYTYGLYRGGLLFSFAPGKVGQFLAQIGITRWDPSLALSIDDFFFLFEPRVNFNNGSLAITVFYHPAYYREKATEEEGSVDLSVDLRFGELAKQGMMGGFSSMVSLRQYSNEDGSFVVDLSPYFSIITSGIEWSFKMDLRCFPFPAQWIGMFRPFIGVKTSF